MQPRNIQGFELVRVLEIMGWTHHHSAGLFRVLIQLQPTRLVLQVEDQWDMTVADVNFILEANCISIDQFWETYESLYQ